MYRHEKTMNKVILSGRATADAQVRWTAGNNQMAIARFTLAVNKRMANGENKANFISCVAFGGKAEFAEKYVKKGMKFEICGELETGSYTNKEGMKVNTTEVLVHDIEFAETKKESQSAAPSAGTGSKNKPGFMDIPDDLGEEAFFRG